MTELLALNHVTMPARDPESLRRWYCDNLGFVRQGDHLWSAGTILSIRKGNPLPYDEWHFGFRLSGKQSLLYWLECLRSRDIEAEGPVGDELFQSFLIRDPEGNIIEFFFEEAPVLSVT